MKILALVLVAAFLTACEHCPETTEQSCKWLLDEKTQEYYEVCK